MLASDGDIQQAIRDGFLQVDPYDPEMVQPASLDLRLDDTFLDFTGPACAPGLFPIIDPAAIPLGMMHERVVGPDEVYLLQPGSFVLGSTLEHVEVGAMMAAKLEGKSSLARLGLLVHATAGFIDPGFAGHITLELLNAAPCPIKLYPGMKIAQLAVMSLHTAARRPYGSAGVGSHYQGQPRGPQPSQSWRNFRTWPTRQEEDTHV